GMTSPSGGERLMNISTAYAGVKRRVKCDSGPLCAQLAPSRPPRLTRARRAASQRQSGRSLPPPCRGGAGYSASCRPSMLRAAGTAARVQDRASELGGAGCGAAGCAADLTDAAAAPRLVAAALQRWGRLDIVVNNAGMISAAVPVFETGTVESMDLVTWQAAL